MDKILVVYTETLPENFQTALENKQCAVFEYSDKSYESEISSSDAIIIITSSSDSSLQELALSLAMKTTAGILFICPAPLLAKIENTMYKGGVYAVSSDTQTVVLEHLIKLLCINKTRLMTITNKYNKLQSRIEETKLINRAKCILIQYLKLTEAQAHRYIEKQAMDTRQSKIDVARNILTTYEA